MSALASPLFLPRPLITGLPSSNHDHGINGLSFDNRGQLYVPIGGNTNAGVPSPELGGLDESPLSETILVASIREPDFDGRVSHRSFTTGVALPDQGDARQAEALLGSGLRVFASGFRNPYDVVWATNGQLYGTDNGPNVGFGKASLTATADTGDPGFMDKALLVGRGHYYGHANRSRGRLDPRENRYRNVWENAPPEAYTRPLAELPSSLDGIDEYRATTFGGALRGALLTQRWDGFLSAVLLSPDGRRSETVLTQLTGTQRGLDVLAGPGGAVLEIDFSGGGIYANLPDDKTASAVVAYDIFPWRAPAGGGFSFVIGGKGFGSVSDTSVDFGSIPAKITAVSPKRIRGEIPATEIPTSAFLPVVVRSGGGTSVIPEAFRFLLLPGQGKGCWRREADVPSPKGGCAAAEVGGLAYVIGEGCAAFEAFNTATGVWCAGFPLPPVSVQKPGLVAVGRELALIGAVGDGGRWMVQIYDPHERKWRSGPLGPWAGAHTAVVGVGRSVFVFGGSVAGVSARVAAAYDVEANVWGVLPELPWPCAEGAAVTDGKSVFVLGGVAAADQSLRFAVQTLDLKTRAWLQPQVAENTTGLVPPGLLGAAASYFAGEVYVFGGRSSAGLASGRIFVWSPATGTWREEVEMIAEGWGMAAVPMECEILVVGGRNSRGVVGAASFLIR